MGVYKKDNRWYIDYYLPDGRRKREVVGPADKITRSVAEKALKARIGEIVQGKFNIEQTKKPVLFDKLLERYIEYAKNNYRAAFRVEVMRDVFLKHFGSRSLSQINSWHIEKYKSERKSQNMKPSTVNRELTILRRMFNLAVQWEMTTVNPVKGVSFYKVTNERLKIYSMKDFKRLYDAAYPNLKPVLIAAIYTGMRLGELLNLKWQDVDFDKACIYVRDSKNFESRTLPMHPEVKQALSKYREESKGEHVFKYKDKNSLGSSFRKVLSNLEIKDLCFHSLRHTFASTLAMNGVDLTTIQELLGHKSIVMTKRYAHPTQEHKKQALSSLNFKIMDTSMDTSSGKDSTAVSSKARKLLKTKGKKERPLRDSNPCFCLERAAS